MPTRVLRNEAEAEDFLRGLTLLGTGGGGRPLVGRRYLKGLLEEGKQVGWTDLAEIPDDAWTCCPFGMGSIAPTQPLDAAEKARLGYPQEQIYPRPYLQAVKELEEYAGVRIGAIAPFELGATNTTAPLDAAVRLGVPMVDGDYSGRAVPELSQTTAALGGKSLCPAAVADPWGNVLVMKGTGSTALGEALGKAISVVTKRADPLASCAHAGFLMPAAEMKKVILPGTMSYTQDVGAAIRIARETGKDPVEAAAAAMKGWVLFEGVVTEKKWESRDGYMYGTTYIRGDGRWAGHQMRIWFKNENHVSWIDDNPFVLSPDLMAMVERETAEPTTNADLEAGLHVAVLGARAHESQRTEAALELLGPQHNGFDLPYRPIETIV